MKKYIKPAMEIYETASSRGDLYFQVEAPIVGPNA